MSKEMLNAFTMLEEEKGIKQEIVIEAIEQAITQHVKLWMKSLIAVLKSHLKMPKN